MIAAVNGSPAHSRSRSQNCRGPGLAERKKVAVVTHRGERGGRRVPGVWRSFDGQMKGRETMKMMGSKKRKRMQKKTREKVKMGRGRHGPGRAE